MLLTVQEHPLRAQPQHCVMSGGNPSRIPVGRRGGCQIVGPDNLSAFSPVCAVLKPCPRRGTKGTTAHVPWCGCAMSGLHWALGCQRGRMLTWREWEEGQGGKAGDFRKGQGIMLCWPVSEVETLCLVHPQKSCLGLLSSGSLKGTEVQRKIWGKSPTLYRHSGCKIFVFELYSVFPWEK